MTKTNVSGVDTARCGFTVLTEAFDHAEVAALRAGVEAAVEHIVELARVEPENVTTTFSTQGHCVQTVRATAIHWEPHRSTVRNLRPVTHLDPRLDTLWDDPRLTKPAAELLGVPEVDPLTSKISFKRAGIGSEYIWHQDYTFLHRFLGPTAREAATAMVFLDDADTDNGTISLLPGSHLTGARPDGEQPRPDDAPPVTIEASAGSVVLFPTMMVHRSGPNRSDRDRRALLFLYQPAGRAHLDETRMYRADGTDRTNRPEPVRP